MELALTLPFALYPQDVYAALSDKRPPVLIDVSRPQLVQERGRLLPASRVLSMENCADWSQTLPRDRSIVIACAHGHNRSQNVAARLKAAGLQAAILAGGVQAWLDAGLPSLKPTLAGFALGAKPGVWVTRRHPKVDRVACAWLIWRFVDPEARFLFVEADQVLAVAADLKAVAYDCPGAPIEHDGALCSFDTLLRAIDLRDRQMDRLAVIIRGADTDRLDLAPQAAGLLAMSLGLSARHGDDDRSMLESGFALYDALWSWLCHAVDETHHWPRVAEQEG
jgi:rhodanese-related sulfurtransferase